VLYLPIKKSWILSCTADRVYLVCTLAAISLIGVLLAMATALAATAANSLNNDALSLLVQTLLWPGRLGTALLCIPVLYYFLVYRRSAVLRQVMSRSCCGDLE
jgi:hypothetical protein